MENTRVSELGATIRATKWAPKPYLYLCFRISPEPESTANQKRSFSLSSSRLLMGSCWPTPKSTSNLRGYDIAAANLKVKMTVDSINGEGGQAGGEEGKE